ncbi:S8 family serine peptidase [Testudinibacter sp. P80/BLE/0925]|uniref:S8 family serine peptidase n=1 Tax=Testudinibacter sp. TW-1 TaxID=3417757 RepID=UPI003D368142
MLKFPVVGFPFKKSSLSLIVSGIMLANLLQAAELSAEQQKLAQYLQQPKEGIGLTDQIAAQYNGSGVVVGVVDSGFFNGHPLLKDKRNLIPLVFSQTLNGKSYRFDPTKLVQETDQESGKPIYSSHGGQVSGIIAANGLQSTQDPRLSYFGGIAKGVTLYQASYEPTSGSPAGSGNEAEDKKLLLGKDPLPRTMFAVAIEQMSAKAPGLHIMNHSWNEDPVAEQAAAMDKEYRGKLNLSNVLISSLHQATEKGVLQVFAAGNESKRQPGILAALPRYFPEMEKHYLSVIAVGADHKLESYSNHCGVSKNWCIAAPGTMALLSIAGDPTAGTVDYSFTAEQGTSYAAPTISAVAALLKQRFEYMDMTQVRDVMLTTATDLGSKGVDDTFGWGMVNVGKALQGPAQLLGDETYTLNRDDRWSNSLSGGGRLRKRGTGSLTLAGDGNRLQGLTVAGGALVLQGDTRLQQSAVVEQGRLQVNQRLQSPSLQVNPQGSLGGSGVIAAASEISGTLFAEGMRFVNRLSLQDSAQFNLLTAQGISADGQAAQVRLAGRLTADGLDLRQAKAGQTRATLLQLQNGAAYSGGFAALQQPQALLSQGLRYDLQFNSDSVLLNVNPSRLSAQSANRNEANAIDALNQLRDSRLAFSRSHYNRWLTRVLQSGDWQRLPQTLGNGIYANSVSYLLDQAALNRTLLQRRLNDHQMLHGDGLQVWSELGRDNSHYRANARGARVDYRATQQTVGVSKRLSPQTLWLASVSNNRFTASQAYASANIREARLSTAARHFLLSERQGWFVEGDLAFANINYKQQRQFNGVADGSHGKTRGWNGSVGFSAGYLWQRQAWTLQPSFGLQVNHLQLKEFSEQGSELALNTGRIRQTETNLLLDLQLNRTFQYGDWQLIPSISLAYSQHLASRPFSVTSHLDRVAITQTATAQQRGHLRTQFAFAVNYHAWQAGLGWQYNGYQQERGSKAYLNIGYRF